MSLQPKKTRALEDDVQTRILLTLSDGRALPISVLAKEAGVGVFMVNSQVSKLLDANTLAVEQHGRFRYYRLSSLRFTEGMDTLAQLAAQPLARSYQVGTPENTLRAARTCYNHLAGQLGVSIMQVMIKRGAIIGHDGSFRREQAIHDRLSAPGRDIEYQLTPAGLELVAALGVKLSASSVRQLRYCVDWSEQRHHLSGHLGAAIQKRFFELGWINKDRVGRAITVTNLGRYEIPRQFGIARHSI